MSGMVAGLYTAYVAKRNSDGYAVGTAADPENLTAGASLAPYMISYPVSVASPDITRAIAKQFGGQKIINQRQLGTSDIGAFEIEVSAFDATFDALVTGGAVDTTTQTGWGGMSAPNVNAVETPEFVLAFQMTYTPESGSDKWLTMFYNNVQIAPGGLGANQNDGVNPNTRTYTVSPSSSTRLATGRLYSATALNVEDDKDISFRVTDEYRLHLFTYIDDGSTTTFTLPYLPKYSDATGAAENSITRNGATLAVTSVNTTTGVVTFTAGTSGDIIIVVYPTDYSTP